MDAGAFVLVQLTSSGWQLVSNGQLVPYASGVLGDQLAAQTILNNTDATNLNGGQFCLGYGTSAEDMIAAGKVQVIATIPDPNPTGTATGTCLVSQIIHAANYSDWWADPAYGGSSVNISQQGSSLGVAWYFYDATGTPTWIFGGGDLSGAAASLTLFSARGVTLGPPTAVSAAPIGTATITFTSDSAATFAFTYAGTSAYPGRSGQLSLSRYTLTSLPIAGTYRYAVKDGAIGVYGEPR